MKSMRLGSFTIAFILVVACGNEAGDPPEEATTVPAAESEAGVRDSGDIDPCALVTKEEAEKALGAPVREAERPSEANIPPRLFTCRYVAEKGDALAVMTVMVRRGYSESEARTGFQSSRELFPDAQDVPGLGDQSYWALNDLNIRRGDTHLVIGGDLDLETARSLGQTALQRLDAR